jgi:hypothetical protein
MKQPQTIRQFTQWLEEALDFLNLCEKLGPPHGRPEGDEALPAGGLPVCQDSDTLYVEIQAAEIVEEARRLACRFDGGHLVGDEVGMVTPREALAIIGRLLNWAREAVPGVATLTVTETARFLR